MGLPHAIFHQDLNMQKKANNIETKVFVKVTNAEPKPVALLLKVKIQKGWYFRDVNHIHFYI